MLDTNEAVQRPRGRAEVLGSVVRRRRWTAEEKGRIVAEAVAPGTVMAQVARRHAMAPQHLSNWIREAKAGRIELPEDSPMRFVPVMAERGRAVTEASAQIEIVAGAMVLHLPCGIDVRTLEAVIRALKRT